MVINNIPRPSVLLCQSSFVTGENAFQGMSHRNASDTGTLTV